MQISLSSTGILEKNTDTDHTNHTAVCLSDIHSLKSFFQTVPKFVKLKSHTQIQHQHKDFMHSNINSVA